MNFSPVSRWTLACAVVFLARPSPSRAEPAKAPPADGDAKGRPSLREIWVPSGDLAPILGRYPRAVSLSRDQLFSLLRDAHAGDAANPDFSNPPPVQAAVRQAAFEGWLATGPGGEAQVRVEGRFEVEALSDAWAEVPLGLPGVALGTAEIDDAPSSSHANGTAGLRRVGETGGGVSVQIQGRGVHRLRVGFVLPVATDADGSTVTLPTVAGVGEFRLHLPAGARAGSPGGCTVQPEANGLVARVALRRVALEPVVNPTAIRDFAKPDHPSPRNPSSAAPDRLSWRTPPPESTETSALLQTGRVEATVSESGAAIRQEIRLRAAFGRLSGEVRFALPAGASAVRVEGASLGQWGIGADGLQAVVHDGENDGAAVFTVDYLLAPGSDAKGTARFDLPVLEAVGAHRVTGEIIVRRGQGITVQRIVPEPAVVTAASGTLSHAEETTPDFVAGFTLVDLPTAANSSPLVALHLDARRQTTRFSVDADTRADFQLDGVRIARTLAFHVEEGELFAARVKLPPGETVSAVHATNGGAEPDWRQEGDELRATWTAGLPTSSETTLAIDSRAEIGTPKPGAPAEFLLRAALVPGAERLTGYIALASAPTFRLVTTGGEDRLERRDGRSTPVRGDMAWFYRDDFRLALRVERRRAESEARFTAYALPLAGAVEIHAQIDYRFLYSGVESVKVRVPREWAEAFYFTGEHIAERRRDDDVWTIRFQGERSGEYALGVQATVPAPADKDDAQRLHFRLPAIVPLEMSHWSGVWAVEANTDTEIRFAVTGANEVDALHAPTLTNYQPRRRIIGAFEFFGGAANTAIDLDGVRHPPAGGAAAVVDRLDLETDASTSGVMRQRATVLARTVGDGFFNLHLPPGAALWSLTLDGEPVKPIRGAGVADEVRVELPGGRNPANASKIVVVYETPGRPWNGAGRGSAVAPGFDDGVPVLRRRWTLSVPEGYEYRFADAPVGKAASDPALGDLLIPRMTMTLGRVARWLYDRPWSGGATVDASSIRAMMTETRKPDSGPVALETPVAMDLPQTRLAEQEAAQLRPAPGQRGDDKAYPESRGRLLAQSANGRELPSRRSLQKTNDSPGTAAITRKLQDIIIPNIEFRQTTLNDAVEFLRQEARRLDTQSPEEERGVNIFLKLASSPANPPDTGIPGLPPGAETSAQTPSVSATGRTRIALTLSRVPLLAALDHVAKAANMKIKVEPYAVSIVPLTEETDDMSTIEIRVPPRLLGDVPNGARNQGSTSATFTGTTDITGAGSGAFTTRTDVKALLESYGVTFPPGSSAVYLAATNKLVIRNTQANLDRMAAIAGESGQPRQAAHLPTLDGRESSQGVSGLLPLRLELPTNGVRYEFDGGVPAALDFHYADWAVAARWRWVCVTLGVIAFLFGAAGWARPWRRTLYAVLTLTVFPLIVAPVATATCNALLAGWLWAVAGWCVTRILLRRKRLANAMPLVCGAALFAFSTADAAPSPSPAPSPEVVIVPYDATKPVAGQQPTAYYLPYERFLLLWDAAKHHRRPPATEPLPGNERYTLGSARYDARLDGETLVIDATLDLQTFGENWVGVPLRFETNRVRAVTLDGAPAALGGDGVLWIGKPGGHHVGVSLRVPAPGVAAGAHLAWSVPPTVATLVTLLLPRADLRPELRGNAPDAGVLEETVPEGRRLTASLGGTSTVELTFRDAPAPAPAAGQPSLASVDARLTASARQESLGAEIRFAFPGSTQDHFTVLFDRSLTLTGLDAPDVRQWRLTTGGDRQTLEITLNTPARDGYRLALDADRPMGSLPAGRRAFPLVSALAVRVERTAALFTEGAVEMSLPDGSPTGMRRVNVTGPAKGHPVAAFAGDGTAEVTYSVRGTVAKRAAHINYLYQVGRGKIELAASVRLLPAAGEPLVAADFRLPEGFAVQTVIGEAVQQWWRDGEVLSLRFRPGAGQAGVPLLVYLVRQFDRAPERFALRPLVANGFAATEGVTVVAADGSFKVGLTLPAGVRSEDLSEIKAATAAREFEVKAPLERQRAFRYHGAEFDVAATLEKQPARWQAQWVTHATVRDGTVEWQTHVNATMLQGSVEALEFSLPPGLGEARVFGPEVREMTVSGTGNERRTYRILFQNALYAGVETEFMVGLELPLEASKRAALPDLTFPSGDGRAAGGFVLVENASSGEMMLDAQGLEPAIEKDVPFLPPSLMAGTHFYRAAASVPWSLGVRVTDLEKTAGRAALVSYAELTTTLRANGEEWHRATYRLQNRRLQFLPVELPPDMELIGARVAGESVRVDAGAREKDAPALLLIPLVKTRPGELSYDVELIYRRAVPGPEPRSSARAFGHWELQDPRLPGIPVEKTLWDVYLPDDARLLNTGGNLEPVVAAVSTTEKLESALSDLRELSATYQSASASDDVRRRALDNYNSLAAHVTRQAKEKSSNWETADADSQGALFKKPDVQSQNVAVSKQQQTILSTVDSLNSSNEIMDQRQSSVFSNGGAGTTNRHFDGFINYGSPIDPALTITGNAGGVAWRDNRAVETHVRAGNLGVDGTAPRGDIETGRDVFALNDSVSVNLPGKDAESATDLKRLEPPKTESTERIDFTPPSENRLSTARVDTGKKAPAAPRATPPATSAPAIPPVTVPVGLPASHVLEPNKEIQREPLRSEGHISLAVDFPLEGQVYHFKKIKSDARLTLWSVQPSHFARLGWLGMLFAGWALILAAGRLLRRRRRPGSIPNSAHA